jgi:hypothetical protein
MFTEKPPRKFYRDSRSRSGVLRRFTKTSLGALGSRLGRHNLIHRVQSHLTLPTGHPPSPDLCEDSSSGWSPCNNSNGCSRRQRESQHVATGVDRSFMHVRTGPTKASVPIPCTRSSPFHSAETKYLVPERVPAKPNGAKGYNPPNPSCYQGRKLRSRSGVRRRFTKTSLGALDSRLARHTTNNVYPPRSSQDHHHATAPPRAATTLCLPGTHPAPTYVKIAHQAGLPPSFKWVQ